MRRAPAVLLATAAGVAAVVGYQPHPVASTASASVAAGAVAGDVVPTRYGNVQVAVTATAEGRITKVTATQLPQGDGRSAQISASASPLLAEQALAAQSAQIDGVSGATYTSEGYAQSLQSALDAL